MPTDVVMPQMGESIFEGTITKWLKQPGDKITRDEPLFEISTDKVDAEIPAPASGVLKEIKAEEGQTVQVNAVVAVIDESGAAQLPPADEYSSRTAAAASGALEPSPSQVRVVQRIRIKAAHRGRRTGNRSCDAADGRIDLRRHDHQVAQEGGRAGNARRAVV